MSRNKEEHVLEGRTAGFVTRLLAYMIDVVVIAGVLAMGGWIAVLIDDVLTRVGLNLSVDLASIYVVMIPFIIFLYFVVQWSLTGRTIGKWFMGLRVVGSTGESPTIGRSTIRVIGYGISALVFWLGYLWVLVDTDRQAWHDHMAATWVVYDYSRKSGEDVFANYMSKTSDSETVSS